MKQQHKAFIIAVISTATILFINALFACKYFTRWLPHSLVYIIAYCIAFPLFQIVCVRKGNTFFSQKRSWLIVAAMVLFWIIALRFIAIEYLRVDRWQMVTVWLDNLFIGRHPYTPLSSLNNVPGPFPVLFILALPFYWLHEIGYYSIAGFLLLAFLLSRIFKGAAVMFCLLSLFFSLSFEWEIFTRSTLFVNVVLILGAVLYYDRCRWTDRRHLLTGGLIGGLLLSTRSIAVIPFAVSFIMLVRTRPLGWRRTGILLCIIAGIFIMTLLPLYIWHPAEFRFYNPIMVQNLLLPAWWIGAIFALCACIAGWFSRTAFEGIFWSGILLLLIVAWAFIVKLIQVGTVHAFYEGRFDISYFIISLPFLIITQQQAILTLCVPKSEQGTVDAVVV